MAGTIRKRGDSFQALLSWRDPITKKSLQVSATAKTEKEAKLALARLMVQKDEQVLAVGKDTFRAVGERYITVIGPRKAEGTIAGLRHTLDAYLNPAFGDLPIKRLTTDHIDRLYTDLLGRGLSPNYVRLIHARLSTICTQARKWKLIAISPTTDVTLPAAKATPFAVLAPEAFSAVLDAAEHVHPMARCYLAVVAAAGARRIEICHLRRGDVDLAAGTISITRTKTEAGVRTEVLPGVVVQMLADHMADQEKVMGELGVIPGAGHYLFFTRVGLGRQMTTGMFDRPLSVRLPDSWFAKSCQMAGVSGVRLHDLRHTHITTLLNSGMAASAVADRVGHSAEAMTHRYGHGTQETDRRAAEIIGQEFFARDADIIELRQEA